MPNSTQWKMRDAANKLHHLSMRYVGAFVEAAKGEKVTFLPKDYPGLKDLRDLIDLVLFQRAEINALTALLVQKKVFNEEEYTVEATEQYTWLTREKGNLFGCTVTESGLVFVNQPDRNN